MSISTNINALIAQTAKVKTEYDKDEEIVRRTAKHIIDKYTPDCALIAKGACQAAEADDISCNYYNYYTAPYMKKSDNFDSTLYMDVFDQVGAASENGKAMLELIGYKPVNNNGIETSKEKFIKKIVFQCCLPGVEILSSDGINVKKGKNFDIYTKWANAAINFYTAVMKQFDKVKDIKKINYEELEKSYMSGEKNNENGSRIKQLSSEINIAKASLIDGDKEKVITDSRNLAIYTISQTIKLFENTNKDGNSSAAWIKRMLDTFNYIMGKNKIYESLVNCFLRANMANHDIFDIKNDRDKASDLVKAMFSIDENKGKIVATSAVKQFKENKKYSIRHLLYYLFN